MHLFSKNLRYVTKVM